MKKSDHSLIVGNDYTKTLELCYTRHALSTVDWAEATLS